MDSMWVWTRDETGDALWCTVSRTINVYARTLSVMSGTRVMCGVLDSKCCEWRVPV
jgi:hypothetical protein